MSLINIRIYLIYKKKFLLLINNILIKNFFFFKFNKI